MCGSAGLHVELSRIETHTAVWGVGLSRRHPTKAHGVQCSMLSQLRRGIRLELRGSWQMRQARIKAAWAPITTTFSSVAFFLCRAPLSCLRRDACCSSNRPANK